MFIALLRGNRLTHIYTTCPFPSICLDGAVRLGIVGPRLCADGARGEVIVSVHNRVDYIIVQRRAATGDDY